jgi:predicted nucleotide-binding protein
MNFPATRLQVSHAEAQERINAQIEKALKISDSLEQAQQGFGFAAQEAVAQAAVDVEKWAKFTIDLLKLLFVDLSIGHEFGSANSPSTGPDLPRHLAAWLSERIYRLESILERLPLFPAMFLQSVNPEQTEAAPTRPKQQSRDIFIVHGYDDAAKHEVARVIEKLGLNPIILHEKQGRTIIEKFEAHCDVGFAVVLLTPDDVGHPKDKPADGKPRARQNVVLELGFFLGKLDRARVCALLKGDVELPTDYSGVLYTPMDANGAWKIALAREIGEAGITVDLNKL